MADEPKTQNSKSGEGQSQASSPKPQLQTVTLKKDHQHAGEKYQAGDTIEVNEADAKWLRENGVI